MFIFGQMPPLPLAHFTSYRAEDENGLHSILNRNFTVSDRSQPQPGFVTATGPPGSSKKMFHVVRPRLWSTPDKVKQTSGHMDLTIAITHHDIGHYTERNRRAPHRAMTFPDNGAGLWSRHRDRWARTAGCHRARCFGMQSLYDTMELLRHKKHLNSTASVP